MDACGQMSALVADVGYAMPTSAIIASGVPSKLTASPPR
jgi:hypothetical protein